MRPIPPRHSKQRKVDALAVLHAFGTGMRTFAFAIFTWLMIVSAMDAWAADDRASTAVLCLFAGIPAYFTYRFLRRFLDDVDVARSPQQS